MISSYKSVFSFDSISCFSSSVCDGLDCGDDALGAGLVDDVTKSTECFFTWAYSTGGEAMSESTNSMERLRFGCTSMGFAAGSILTGLFGKGRVTGTGGNGGWAGLAATLLAFDVSRGLTSGTLKLVDALVSETWRTGGLGGIFGGPSIDLECELLRCTAAGTGMGAEMAAGGMGTGACGGTACIGAIGPATAGPGGASWPG